MSEASNSNAPSLPAIIHRHPMLPHAAPPLQPAAAICSFSSFCSPASSSTLRRQQRLRLLHASRHRQRRDSFQPFTQSATAAQFFFSPS